jgi:CBS domain-containing membrane protein
MSSTDVRQCTVYGRHGDPEITSIELEPPREPPRRRSTISDRIALRDIMSPEVVCASPDLEIGAVVSLVIRHHVGCVPVVDERRRPIGMITKFDLVEQLDATMQAIGTGSPLPSDLSPRNADEVMMPIALVLDEHATVAHAATMMSLEDTHHVLVVRAGGELVGVVSTKDIVNWLVANDGLVPSREANDPGVPPTWNSIED